MSNWTHITACLSIDTCTNLTRSEMRKELKHILKIAPKITGSENDAEIFINIPKGYNCSSYEIDCKGCEYEKTSKTYTDAKGREWEECAAPSCTHR